LRIRTAWFNANFPDVHPDNQHEINIDRTFIQAYLGTYGDSVAVLVGISPSMFVPGPWFQEVAGYEFLYNMSYTIAVWNNDVLYMLKTPYPLSPDHPEYHLVPRLGAYDAGLLTEQDVGFIHFVYNLWLTERPSGWNSNSWAP
jgi:hypothetical protein